MGAHTNTGAGVKSGPSIVLVPRAPSALQQLDREHRPADELDQLIDEVFGDTTREGPGWFDVTLVVLGAAITVWALVAGLSWVILAIGLGLVLLGVALPARSVLIAVRARRAMARRRRAFEQGYPLDLSSPSTSALAQRYSELLEVARLPGTQHPAESVAAAHQAVIEVASLLQGEPPRAPAEIDYVERRAMALGALVEALRRDHAAWVDSRSDMIDEPTEARQLRARAVVEARDELDAATGLGALAELEELAARTAREAPDAFR